MKTQPQMMRIVAIRNLNTRGKRMREAVRRRDFAQLLWLDFDIYRRPTAQAEEC